MRSQRLAILITLVASFQGFHRPVPAWWAGGHGIVARSGAGALPKDVPAFFRHSREALAEFSAEPDVWKNRATPHLDNAEWPEHFMDWELLGGRTLPPLRWDYVALCAELRRNPHDVGLLPYAIAEWTERLALAFAEFRRSPEDSAIQHKCIVYGGILSHYAADLAQPLHLTVDYDGRTTPGAPSPRTGIHDRMDALLQAVRLQPREIASEIKPVAFGDVFTSTVREIILNRQEIDTVYALEADLPVVHRREGIDPGWRPSERIHQLAMDRARAAAYMTASCWLTAWVRSRSLEPHGQTPAAAAPETPTSYSPVLVLVVIAVTGLVLFLSAYRLGKRVTSG
jgi:hypothetical protein